MGAHRNRENFGGNDDDPTTLCEWVRSFRIKRSQMKRKLRGNLRVNAMLNTALENAEAELRRKQRERFCRWTEFQAKLDKSYDINNRIKDKISNEDVVLVDAEQRDTINDLWKSELSDLDTFMRSLSSTSRNCYGQNAETNAYQNDHFSNMKISNYNARHSIAVVS
ncbi:uncharacterized protein [Eurosta solidaginis]|uniref:uncharacterized protein n=1 Tax=Eurosta solidaginis TaxID=178769 RepID=UPI003530A1C8